MPFDTDDDPICKLAWADLLVSGDHIEGDEFTRLFGISPTDTAKAGDCSGWRVSSKSQVQSTNLERHIHWILDRISGKEEVVKDLKETRKCQVDIGCWWQGRANDDQTGPLLTPETLRRVSDFNMNLIFYFIR